MVPVRVGCVSILDDARPGMDLDTRPQDDLFGHVNGRWLAETEIPSDKSSWGAFIALADAAEQQVRDMIAKATAEVVEKWAAGPIGPYVKKGDDFRSLTPDDDVYTVSLERAKELLAQEKKSIRRQRAATSRSRSRLTLMASSIALNVVVTSTMPGSASGDTGARASASPWLTRRAVSWSCSNGCSARATK